MPTGGLPRAAPGDGLRPQKEELAKRGLRPPIVAVSKAVYDIGMSTMPTPAGPPLKKPRSPIRLTLRTIISLLEKEAAAGGSRRVLSLANTLANHTFRRSEVELLLRQMPNSTVVSREEQLASALQLPFDVLAEAYKRRAAELRAKHGPRSQIKKFRECKGCGKEFSAREMRTHPCVISWRKRT